VHPRVATGSAGAGRRVNQSTGSVRQSSTPSDPNYNQLLQLMTVDSS
jgi:hypothetical protein